MAVTTNLGPRFGWVFLFLSVCVSANDEAPDSTPTLGAPATTASAQDTAPERPEPSPSFLRQIGRDFGDVFTTKDNLFILAGGGGASLAASTLDDEIANGSFNSEINGGTGLDNAFEAGEILGGALVQVGGAVATWGVGKLASSPEAETLGRELVRAQIVTQSLTFGLKVAASRERPDGSNQRSFPSGHASGTFATATVLQRRYGWKVGVPAYAVAGYVGASRLNEGAHFLSDVVFGATIGILVGRSLSLEIGDSQIEIGPMATPGGFGVQARLVR
ncbi:MAG TPA: phosphatase PAP2 family protein [Vicinamibacteria bacterium]|nr:phosphatase PAP2 family protein [Vicinamibacteria bacterium]